MYAEIMELYKFPLNYYIMQTSDLDITRLLPGGSLSSKMLSYQYRDPHVKDKRVSQPSYL